VGGHFGGITVSTLAEAKFFAAAGFRDITYAFPLPVPQLPEIAEFSRSLERLNLLLDHEKTLKELEAFASARRMRFSVFLKVDCGDHRAGVDPAGEEGMKLAQELSRSSHVEFCGILTHAGHSYGCRDRDEIRLIAREERDVMARFARKLRDARIEVPVISIGSTPTMSLADNLEGITEVRPGNYVFYDATQAAIGSCTLEDAAFSVLATVVGHYPLQNKLIINAGALALSKDDGPRHVDRDCGYGVMCSPDGARRYPELRLFALSQEHGQVHGTRPLDFSDYPIGCNLRIIPNHSCLASAMYDHYTVLRGSQIVDDWKPVKGW
jgi:D-serine deaminase-like pyridoxal phosphate-dependent protein